jgi:hypothetical protein
VGDDAAVGPNAPRSPHDVRTPREFVNGRPLGHNPPERAVGLKELDRILFPQIGNVVSLAKIIRDFEPKRWREHVICVKRRRVASHATLLLEDAAAPACVLVE